MTQAQQLPLHMRRNTFNPTPELREIRETTGVRTIVSAFGMEVYLLTRHEDVKAVLADHQRFSNGRPPGFVVPGAPPVSPRRSRPARGRAICSASTRPNISGCAACSPRSSPSAG